MSAPRSNRAAKALAAKEALEQAVADLLAESQAMSEVIRNKKFTIVVSQTVEEETA
jgi:hypothetical protein